MAYQKLQVSSALDVIPSNTVDIPNPTSAVSIQQHQLLHTGTAQCLTDGVTMFDLSSNFFYAGGPGTPLGIQAGDIVTNTDTGVSATVTETPTISYFALTLSPSCPFPVPPASGEAYKITRPDNKVRVDFGDAVQHITSEVTLYDNTAGKAFVTTVSVGDRVINIDTGLAASVVSVDNDSLLTLDASIMPGTAGPAQNYDILQVAPIANIAAGDFSVSGVLTLVPGALASEVGILPGAIVYNTGGSIAYTITSVVSDTELAISPATPAGAADAFQIYNEATDAAVLYSGGAAQNIKLTMASNTVDTFKGVPTGAYLPLQVKRVWGTSSAPTDIIALW